MKKLRNKICSYTLALLVSAGFATPSFSGSSDFSGIFVAGHAELNVAVIDGTHTTGDGDDAAKGSIGGFAPTAGYEVGVNLPLGDTFFVTIGYADGGGGTGTLAKSKGGHGNNDAEVYIKGSDPSWYYIAPSISIFDNSAIYVKLGQASLDLKAEGDTTATLSGIDGDMWGIGTTTIAGNGLFFKTEAGAIQYDQFTLTGVGGSANAIVEGNPLVGYGHLSIGYKF
ncbi:MAG: hypothetical protein EVA76_00235 [Candidatus Pelagibacterales bacterium]|nr:MAG: hypothetical protein EVA76_00235 [Pelagibacterales bacterium]